VKVLMSDNGSEYISKEFKDYLVRKGIKHQLSISGRSEQNEVAESINQTLIEHTHSIRLQTDISEGFWAEAVNHASYLINMSPSIPIDLQIPEEIWRGVLWTIEPYEFSVAWRIVWLIVKKETNWSPSLRNVSSSGSPKQSSVLDFGIPRKGAPLPTEMWSLIKNQCCKKSQRRRIKHKVELQTVRQTLKKRKLSSQRALKGLKGQKRTPQIQIETNRRLL